MSDQAIMELNLPTGIPIVYELDQNLKPTKPMRFLGDEETVRKGDIWFLELLNSDPGGTGNLTHCLLLQPLPGIAAQPLLLPPHPYQQGGPGNVP